MINGLKSQLKVMEMDKYRQETKIVSLQSQIDTMRANEKRLEAIASRGNASLIYSPGMINKELGINSSPSKSIFESKNEKLRDNISRGSTQRSKPLIKSTAKISKKEDPKEDIMNEIMSRKPTNYDIHSDEKDVQKSKPNILLNKRKSQNSFHDDQESTNSRHEHRD
mmetsp:Transcript_3981/g.4861  ORF Transcript_3981/g.4861 Transcript_3981/m.4861 type:complete len:167 (-) Transcript_3981:26-526(-)